VEGLESCAVESLVESARHLRSEFGDLSDQRDGSFVVLCNGVVRLERHRIGIAGHVKRLGGRTFEAEEQCDKEE